MVNIVAHIGDQAGSSEMSSTDLIVNVSTILQVPLPQHREHNSKTVETFLIEMDTEKPRCFSPMQVQSITSNFSTSLGSGSFGEVYKGKLSNGVQVAVKVLKERVADVVEKQFMAEVGTIGRTYHRNLVRLYGFCFDPNMKALIYEYMENGSLDKMLYDKNQNVELEKLYNIAIGTAKGLSYLHEDCQQRIIHYDIKASNVLLDIKFCPKVGDFGLAKLCNRDNTNISMTGFKGTPGYAAPEQWMPFPATHKCDVYSYGIMLFEFVGRRRHWDNRLGESQKSFPRLVWDKFEEGQLDELLTDCGIEEKDREKAKRISMLALWCVQYMPQDRPSMSIVVQLLEGREEVMMPPNPFRHLVSSGLDLNLSITCYISSSTGKGIKGTPSLVSSNVLGTGNPISKKSLSPASPLGNDSIEKRTAGEIYLHKHSSGTNETITHLRNQGFPASGGKDNQAVTGLQDGDEGVYMGGSSQSQTADSENSTTPRVTSMLKDMGEKLPPGVYDVDNDSMKPVYLPNPISVFHPDTNGENHLSHGSTNSANLAFSPSGNNSMANGTKPMHTHLHRRDSPGTNGTIVNLQNQGFASSSGKYNDADVGQQDDNGGVYKGGGNSRSQAADEKDHEPLQNGDDVTKSSIVSNSNQVETEWIEQYEPGIYITVVVFRDGTRDLKRVRFSRRRFGEYQAETWWSENREKVYERYNIRGSDKSS